MISNRLVSIGALVMGSLTAVLGTALAAMYVVEAVFARMGDPDQSLLFWYLPILFMGIAAMVLGIGATVWAWRRLRANRR